MPLADSSACRLHDWPRWLPLFGPQRHPVPACSVGSTSLRPATQHPHLAARHSLQPGSPSCRLLQPAPQWLVPLPPVLRLMLAKATAAATRKRQRPARQPQRRWLALSKPALAPALPAPRLQLTGSCCCALPSRSCCTSPHRPRALQTHWPRRRPLPPAAPAAAGARLQWRWMPPLPLAGLGPLRERPWQQAQRGRQLACPQG